MASGPVSRGDWQLSLLTPLEAPVLTPSPAGDFSRELLAKTNVQASLCAETWPNVEGPAADPPRPCNKPRKPAPAASKLGNDGYRVGGVFLSLGSLAKVATRDGFVNMQYAPGRILPSSEHPGG